jgi:N-acetylneuraminate lyase
MRYIGFECGEFRSPVKNMTKTDYYKFVEDVKALDMEREFSKLVFFLGSDGTLTSDRTA